MVTMIETMSILPFREIVATVFGVKFCMTCSVRSFGGDHLSTVFRRVHKRSSLISRCEEATGVGGWGVRGGGGEGKHTLVVHWT